MFEKIKNREIHTEICTKIHTKTDTHTHTRIDTEMHTQIHTKIQRYTHTYWFKDTHTQRYTHRNSEVCIAYMHTDTYIKIHRYTHTHTQREIQTYTLSFKEIVHYAFIIIEFVPYVCIIHTVLFVGIIALKYRDIIGFMCFSYCGIVILSYINLTVGLCCINEQNSGGRSFILVSTAVLQREATTVNKGT